MLCNGKQALKIWQTAKAEGWALGAFNIMDMATTEAVISAAEELDIPCCVQVGDSYDPEAPEASRMSEKDANLFAEFVINRAKAATVPVIIHLDHCPTFGGCIRGIKNGCASIMMDASQEPFDKNVAAVKKVVEAAKACSIVVEGEIGHVGGHPNSHGAIYTEVEDAVRYEQESGCDLTAVSIGTVHGFYKSEPVLNYERIAELNKACKNPLVMHGSSGLSEEQFKKSIAAGIAKINFATYAQMAGGAAQKEFVDKASEKGDHIMMMFVNAAGQNACKEYVKKHMQIFGTKKVAL